MKKVLVVLAVLFLFSANAFAEIVIDISGSQVEIQNASTMRIRNVTAPGVPGKYWIDFQWDAVNLVYVPINLGEEAAATGHTWSWTILSVYGNYVYTITSDPVQRKIYVSYQQSSGSPVICSGEHYIQGNNSFQLSQFGMPDNSTAKLTYTTAFTTCSYIYSGQTVSATISDIPAWFDFTKSFMVGLSGEVMICEPDGSVHK